MGADIYNFSSAYRGDGKSVVVRMITEKMMNSSARILIIDNSRDSGFRKMYDFEYIAGIDELRPFIKGEMLTYSQLKEIIVEIENNVHYIANSEVEEIQGEDMKYLLNLVKDRYSHIFIESSGHLKVEEIDVKNFFITRPCEKVMKQSKKICNKYDVVILNKYEEETGMLPKKSEIMTFPYDKEVIFMENGYNYNFSDKTSNTLNEITEDILGFTALLENKVSEKLSIKDRIGMLFGKKSQ